MKRYFILSLLPITLALAASGCEQASATQMPTLSELPEQGDQAMSFKLISIAFNPGEPILMKYTCDGEDISPPLQWSGAPKNVQSFALIMDDPDAGGFVHWVLYNLPPEVHGLPEAVPADTNLADHGKNSWHRLEYGGPCPPSGTHRYSFKLFALDAMLDLDASASKADVIRVMQGHILSQTELMGTYSRH